jgi:GH35 family endo-1,4-beta-xylanase|uniref:Beta-xylanase n=1 Tax=uncultured bacterium contig00195 TaxID=1181607 RepID=A0A806KPV4_9BACT|nr:endo-1,4-beta-xylanase A precursor [uncultured bacterium contig00195]
MKTLLIATLLLLQVAYAQQGLKDVYAPYFKFGNILNGSTVNNQAMRTLLLREFNSVTPENELKPDATIVANGSTNTDVKVTLSTGARNILKFCEDNNIPVRGHTLVWHSQTPGWFFREGFSSNGAVVSKAVMSQRMESYIKNILALIYKDYPNLDLYAYDVVNEAASESGGPRTAGSDAGNGQSMWVQVYGDNSFVEEAFRYARQYAKPSTKLYYNDYNEYIQAKRDYIANSIVRPLFEKGLLDGMGMQSHLDVRGGNDAYPSATLYGQAITTYKNIGVDIHITELDATVNNSNFTAQATYYKNIMNEILTKGGSAVKAVVVWGLQDNQSWRSDRNPLLWDGSGNKKSAYTEVYNLAGTTSPPSSSSRPPSSSSIAPSSSSSRQLSSSSSRPSSSSSSRPSSSSSLAPSSSSTTPSSSSSAIPSSSSSEAVTPILSSPQSLVPSPNAPRYYNLKGEPLGNAKPSNPGVYIEKNGKNVRKIVVK